MKKGGMGMMFQRAGGGGTYAMQPQKSAAPTNLNYFRSAMEAKEAVLKATYVEAAKQKVKKFTRDWLEDDDEEEHPSMKKTSNIQGHRKTSASDQEEDDPLDAFMANINKAVNTQKTTESKASTSKPEVLSYQDQDYETTTAGNIDLATRHDSDYDSEAEIYAAEANEVDEEGRVPGEKKKIEPLPTLDHSKIQYEPFRKMFYCEHPEVSQMSENELDMLCRRLEVFSQGDHCPRPLPSFKHAGFDPKLLQTIVRHGLEAPTPIQAQAIPAALSGRDLIAIAKTGSGKTYAFVWPIIVHVMDQRVIEKGEGPIAVILSPTRELASQIFVEAKKYAKPFDAKVCALIGGSGKWEMQKALREGPEIVVATPGRLIEMIKCKATNMQRCTFVVLDEADRMFEMGFEYQMRSIVNQIRPDRQTLMFSATFKKKIQSLARDILHDPIKITVGVMGQANEDVNQIITVMHDGNAKWQWLLTRMPQFLKEGKVLIFVTSKNATEELSKSLGMCANIKAGAIHGDKDQTTRSEIMAEFKRGLLQVLVATDVAARGLDIKGVNTVVNYDAAKNIETHIHRVGRTGRMSKDGQREGTAHTLICQSEAQFAFDLCRNLELSGQPIPEELEKLASRTGRARRSVADGSFGDFGSDSRRGAGIGFGGGLKDFSQPLPTQSVPQSYQSHTAATYQTPTANSQQSFVNLEPPHPETAWQQKGHQNSNQQAPSQALASQASTVQTDGSEKRKRKSRWDN